jgi:hypothetical protein
MDDFKREVRLLLLLSVGFFTFHLQAQESNSPLPNRLELAHFLVKVKRATHASQSDDATVKNVLPAGTHQLEFSEGNFFYRDIYAGDSMFAGQEIVYYAGKPVWSMSYTGEIPTTVARADVGKAVRLLHKAPMNVSEDIPYRGPRWIREGEFVYVNHPGGSFASFFGDEVIRHVRTALYTLHYEGGLMR